MTVDLWVIFLDYDSLGEIDGELFDRFREGGTAEISRCQAAQSQNDVGGTVQARRTTSRNGGDMQGRGRSCYKYMLAAGTASSPASIKDMRKEGESTAARVVSEPLGGIA